MLYRERDHRIGTSQLSESDTITPLLYEPVVDPIASVSEPDLNKAVARDGCAVPEERRAAIPGEARLPRAAANR